MLWCAVLPRTEAGECRAREARWSKTKQEGRGHAHAQKGGASAAGMGREGTRKTYTAPLLSFAQLFLFITIFKVVDVEAMLARGRYVSVIWVKSDAVYVVRRATLYGILQLP